jgi:uncharacterized protein YjdB
LGGYRWASSAPTAASVSANGVVHGLAAGRSTITVAAVARPSLVSAALVEVRAP